MSEPARIRVDVLFFGSLAEALATERLAVELPAGASVGDLLDHLAQLHPAVAAARPALAVAVDERYSRQSAVLRPGASVALVPPVSGG
jgi:molybdopterin converting factor subunit 1